MKILFLTRKFAPQNYIGAIRPTKLAKYLVRLFGHEVEVICMKDTSELQDNLTKNDIYEIAHIETLPYCKLIESIKKIYAQKASKIKRGQVNKYNSKIKADSFFNKAKKLFNYFCQASIRNILYLISIYDSYLYGKRAIKYLKNNNKQYQYHAFFSTTNLIESFIVGKWLKRQNHKIKWIYDLRDPIRINSYPYIAKKIIKYILNKTIYLVDEVTGVSEACVSEFKSLNYTSINIIPNGFDYDDIKEFKIESANYNTNGNLKIVYTGTLYEGKSDIKPLLLLLLELAKEGKIDLSKIELHYAGNNFQVLNNIKNNLEVDIKLINHGFIPREEALKLQKNADILLLLSWNYKWDTGIVTGKFYEYLMMKKPICCLIKGDVPKSTLQSLIKESDVGVCYEEADKETWLLTKNFLVKYYNIVVNHLIEEKYNIPNNKIQRFNYSNITSQLNNLLCKK